ncbi:MAG: hypothetical protein AAF587_21960 [Bacteroidota bacterium]
MAKRTRQSLSQIFIRGNISGQHYADLIESSVNILDDGIDFDEENGLKITAKGPSEKLMSFYEKTREKNLAFSINLNPNNQRGLNIAEGKKDSRIFIQEGGNVGIGTITPAYKMDVKGIVAMEGRIGTFASNYAPADGDWHTIKDGLHGTMGFEVMAHINDEKDQRFALTHAILLMSSGKRGAKTRSNMVRAGSPWFWGRFWNKILFRWKLDEGTSTAGNRRYLLQIKTRTHYGKDASGQPKQIFYRLMRIWDSNFEKEVYENPMTVDQPQQSRRNFPQHPQQQPPQRRQPQQDDRPSKPKFTIRPK